MGNNKMASWHRISLCTGNVFGHGVGPDIYQRHTHLRVQVFGRDLDGSPLTASTTKTEAIVPML